MRARCRPRACRANAVLACLLCVAVWRLDNAPRALLVMRAQPEPEVLAQPQLGAVTPPLAFMGRHLAPADVQHWNECVAAMPRVSVAAAARAVRRAPMDIFAANASSYASLRGKHFPRVPALADWFTWARDVIEPVKPFSTMAYLTFSPGDPEEALHPAPPRSVDACVFQPTDDEHPQQCDLHAFDAAADIRVSRECGALVGALPAETPAHPCLPHAPYDLISLQQTLEHLYDPTLAMLRLRRLLARGGWLHTTVPFFNMAHLAPHHFGGLSPCGLFALARSVGLETVGLGWWGSRREADLLTAGVWGDYTDIASGVEERGALPAGDGDLAIQSWLLARRSDADDDSFVEPFSLSLRPPIVWANFSRVDLKSRELRRSPAGATALRLLLAHPDWADEDARRLVVAAIVADFFPPPQPSACGPSSVLLVFGTIAELAAAALDRGEGGTPSLTPWRPGAETAPCAAGALVSDLWAAVVDPFAALVELTESLPSGAPILITCDVAADVSMTQPRLALCTRNGLVATALRAGLMLDRFDVWGSHTIAAQALKGEQTRAADVFIPAGVLGDAVRLALSSGGALSGADAAFNQVALAFSARLEERAQDGFEALAWIIARAP